MSGLPFDGQDFRRACGQFLTGVTIVTTRAENGTPLGVTANSFSSLSLDPPLVLVCLAKRLASYAAFREGRTYAVHVLAAEQAELSTRFATRGVDKFAGLAWREGLGGAPLIPGYLALFECSIVRAVDGGDHTIFLGQVERLDVAGGEPSPLGFFRGTYVEVHHRVSGPVVREEPPGLDAMWALGWA